MVTSREAGLSVPDWPLSYGQLMPPMEGGILYEHGHRMVATTVGLLTIVSMIWLLRAEKRVWMRWLGVAALIAVILQGVLGGLTVLYLSALVDFVGSRLSGAAFLFDHGRARDFHLGLVATWPGNH